MSESEKRYVTRLFEEYTTDTLTRNFGGGTEYLLKFANKFFKVCVVNISTDYPAHITNPAMKATMEGWDEWGVHVAGRNRSMVWKLEINGKILNHQMKQWKKMENEPEGDVAKAFQNAMEGTEFKEPIDFFSRMFSFFYC